MKTIFGLGRIISIVAVCVLGKNLIALAEELPPQTVSTDDGVPLATFRIFRGVDTSDNESTPVVFQVNQTQPKLCQYRFDVVFANGASGTCTKVIEVKGRYNDSITRKCAKNEKQMGVRLVAWTCSEITP